MVGRKYEVQVARNEEGEYVVTETPRDASLNDSLYEKIFQSSLELAERRGFERLGTEVETW